ncbi:MAG: trimeric intracellular cation channel family protein [Actinomycetota bacterium]
MAEAVLQPPPWVELPAVVAGALAGALFAQRRGLDVIGVLALALVSGLGGGILRDVLLARIPLALQESWYLLTVAAAAMVGAFFAEAANRMRLALLAIDAISLGLFTVVGVQGGLSAGLPAPTAILLGIITGVGGSVLRDVLVGETPPRMLRRGPPYASAAALGAVVYVGLVVGLDVRQLVAQVTAVIVVCLVRGVASWRNWGTPEPHDLTPRLLRPNTGRGPASPDRTTDDTEGTT